MFFLYFWSSSSTADDVADRRAPTSMTCQVRRIQNHSKTLFHRKHCFLKEQGQRQTMLGVVALVCWQRADEAASRRRVGGQQPSRITDCPGNTHWCLYEDVDDECSDPSFRASMGRCACKDCIVQYNIGFEDKQDKPAWRACPLCNEPFKQMLPHTGQEGKKY